MTLDVLSFRLTRIAGHLVSVASCALTGRMLVAAAGFAATFAASAANVLIVNYNIISTLDTNLQARLQAAGNTATIVASSALPTDLSSYTQVWDLGANQAIGNTWGSTLTGYLQNGGTVFMMGENSGYGATRNAAMSTLLGNLGAGTVTVTGNSIATQTIDPALLGANQTPSVTFAAIGKFSSVGTGTCIISDCGAAAWNVGTLSNAARGALISVLDVNFLQTGYFQSDFTDNLISYLAQQSQAGNSPATDIGTGAAAYDASQLGATLNPVFQGGTLNINAPSMTLAQNFTIGDQGGTIQVNGTDVRLTGAIADAQAGTPGALTVAGTGGRVTIEGAGAYTGATTVGAGATLALAGAGSIATSSHVVVDGAFDLSAAGAPVSVRALDGSGQVALGATTLTLTAGGGSFDGVIAGAGGVRVAGGTQTLGGANAYTGATAIDAGATLVLAGAGGVASSSAVTVNGALDLAGATAGAQLNNLQGSGTVALGSNTLTVAGGSGAFSGTVGGLGNVTLQPNAVLTLSGANTYAGTTTVGSNAQLVLAGAGTVGTSDLVNSGTVDISGTTAGVTVKTLTGNGQVVLGAQTLTIQQGQGAFAGHLTGAGNLVLNGGSLVFGADQAYTGTTTVAGGVLSVNANLAGAVAVASGAALHGSGHIAGPVTVASGATLAPGNSPGVMTTSGTVTLSAGSTFEVDVNGATAGNGAGFHDQLVVVGAGHQFIANGAAVDVNLTDITGLGAYTAYVPALGDSYRIVVAEGGLGSTRFAPLAQPDGLAAGTRLRLVYNTGNGTTPESIDLKVVPTALASTASTRNTLATAAALDGLIAADEAGTATTDQSRLANAVLGLDGAALDATVVALTGEIHAALAAAQPLSGQLLQGAVAKHLAMSPLSGEARLTGWADYTTGETRWSADAVSSGVRSTHNQLTVGVDVWQSGASRAGVAVASTSVQVTSSAGSSGKLAEDLIVAYGQHAFAGIIGDAQLGHGSGQSRSRRADPLAPQNDALTTDLSTRQDFAALGVRKAFDVAGATLEPFARFSVQRVRRDAGTETGSSLTALSVDALSASGNRTSVGLSVTGSESNPMVSQSTFRGTLAVGRDGGELLRPVVGTTLGGTASTVQAPEAGRSFVAGNVFGTWLLAPGAYAYAGIGGEARSQRVQKSVAVGAAIAF